MIARIRLCHPLWLALLLHEGCRLLPLEVLGCRAGQNPAAHRVGHRLAGQHGHQEREGENEWYFRTFSEPFAYPMGINIVFYAMTH